MDTKTFPITLDLSPKMEEPDYKVFYGKHGAFVMQDMGEGNRVMLDRVIPAISRPLGTGVEESKTFFAKQFVGYVKENKLPFHTDTYDQFEADYIGSYNRIFDAVKQSGFQPSHNRGLDGYVSSILAGQNIGNAKSIADMMEKECEKIRVVDQAMSKKMQTEKRPLEEAIIYLNSEKKSVRMRKEADYKEAHREGGRLSLEIKDRIKASKRGRTKGVLYLDGLDINDYQLKLICEELKGSRKSIEMVSINENKITDLSPLSQFENMRQLSCADNGIKSLKGVENLKKLEGLNLNNNLIESADMLMGLTQLRELSISENEIGQTYAFDSLKNLTSLFVDDNKLKVGKEYNPLNPDRSKLVPVSEEEAEEIEMIYNNPNVDYHVKIEDNGDGYGIVVDIFRDGKRMESKAIEWFKDEPEHSKAQKEDLKDVSEVQGRVNNYRIPSLNPNNGRTR